MISERKTGTYFVEGLSSKSNKRIVSRNFKTSNEAVNRAREWKRKGKIVQGSIYFTKNILTDVKVWDMDLSGNVSRYNESEKRFENFDNDKVWKRGLKK